MPEVPSLCMLLQAGNLQQPIITCSEPANSHAMKTGSATHCEKPSTDKAGKFRFIQYNVPLSQQCPLIL